MSLSAQLAPKVRARALQKVNAARIRIEGGLDLNVPVKTGALKKSKRIRVLPGSQIIALQIEYPVPYAGPVDKGPKAHVIRARRVQFLRFGVKGGLSVRRGGRTGPGGTRVLYRKQVNWRPGPGVARNKRWFSKEVTLTAWRRALR